MVLDARLKDVVRDAPAGKSARAFARSLSSTGSLAPEDKEDAAEFEALIESMFLMALVDGEIAKDELVQLSSSVQAIISEFEEAEGAHSSSELALPVVKLNEVLETLGRRYSEEGRDKRFEALAGNLRSREMKRLCYRLAAGVAFVDDYVDTGEIAALDDLARLLELSPDESQSIMREVHDALSR